jgi:Rieske Fe-S protein
MRKTPDILKISINNDSAVDGNSAYEISRRRFLSSSALVVLPVLCAGCTDDSPPVTTLPPVMNKAILIPLGDFSVLAQVGGSVVGQAEGYPNPIVIARYSSTMFVALDAICTHMRCAVAYNALNLTLDCPCHGSTYEANNGNVISGPAPRPLTRFTASSDGTTLTIMLP